MGQPRLTDEQRGPLGAWAYHARVAKFSNTEKAADALASYGIKMLPDTLRGVETGHSGVSPEVLDALEALYVSKAPPLATETHGGGLGALWAVVEALRSDVAALQGKVRSLEAALAAERSTGH